MGKVSFYDYLSTLTPKVPCRKEELKTFLAERNIVVDPRAGELKSKAKDCINNHGHHDDTLIKIGGVLWRFAHQIYSTSAAMLRMLYLKSL